MSIFKTDFPILEYDTAQQAIFMPSGEGQEPLPKRAVFAFLGELVEEFAKEKNLPSCGDCKTISKTHHFYVMDYKGKEVCLCEAPLGAAAAVTVLEELIARGVQQVITVGSCGVLVDLPENEFLIPTEALRDEGTSYHYLPPERTVTLDAEMCAHIAKILAEKGLQSELVKTWTTDAIFRETADMVAYRKEEGCKVVEMECAALAACAKLRGVRFGQFLYTADTLANVEIYDARDFGKGAMPKALELALDCASAL